MKRSHSITLALVGLIGGLAFAGTAAASKPATDLGPLKAKCDAAISTRQAELDKLSSRAGSAPHLSGGHKSTIDSIIGSSKSGLGALQTKIDADTDLATLKADCDAVASEYRVFALRSPQVHLALAGDRESAGVAKANDIAAKLQTAITKAEGNGKDVTDAKAKLADMKAKLADAGSKLSGTVDSELGLTPSQWNADHSVLAGPTQALRTAGDDLKAALADAKAIVADLKA
ncbi:MAG: hypothetical protein WCK21_00115 [Actinomycetota bacterium]